MKNLINHRSFTVLAGLVVTALVTGCNQPPKLHGETFYKDGAPTDAGNFAQAQCAAGAKEDGILYEANFHGTELNSLGQGKLDLIVKGTTPGDAIYIHLNMPHEMVAARQAAVTAYLKNAGVSDNAMIVAEGNNPNINTPTAYNLNGVYKIDNNTPNGQAAADAGGAGLSAH